MKYQVIWKEKARNDYLQIVEYLREEHGRKSALKFIDRVDTVTRYIVQSPYIYPGSKKKDIRKAFINKHNSMYYKVREEANTVEFLFFWNNRRNPDDLPI